MIEPYHIPLSGYSVQILEITVMVLGKTQLRSLRGPVQGFYFTSVFFAAPQISF